MESLSGTYALILASAGNEHLQIGRLGQLQVRSGYYVYLGSAFGPGGVKARISHHRKTATRPHWHIDYLSSSLPLDEVWYSYDPIHREHQWADLFKRMEGSAIPLKKFGASDCDCVSHLFFFPNRPSKTIFLRKLHSHFRDHKPIHEEKIN